MRALISPVTVFLVLMGCLIRGDLALAQTAAVELQLPPKIELKATEVDLTLSDEFSIRATGEIDSLTITPGPLKSEGSTVVSAEVTLEPGDLTGLRAGETRTVKLTIKDVPALGVYDGEITVAWGGESKVIPVHLVVGRAIGDLPAEVHLTLQAKADGTGYEYRGVLRIASVAASDISGLKLVNFTCLAREDTPGGCDISETGINLTPAEAVTLPPGETKAFDIKLDGLPANTGQYTGTFEVTYDKWSGKKEEVKLFLRADRAFLRADNLKLELKPEASGGSYKDSFVLTLEGGLAGEFSEVDKIEFSPGSLRCIESDASSDCTPIAADRITMSPESGTLTLNRGAPVRTVTVSVTPPTGEQFPAGTYEGTMTMYYRGTGAQYQPENSLTFTLNLEIGRPAISKDLSQDLPPLLQQTPGGPYQTTFYVALEAGEMRDIKFNKSPLVLTTDQGIRIEAGDQQIDPDPPEFISPKTGPVAFTIKVTPPTGSDLQEGKYTGTLGMSYANGHTSFDLELIANPDATLEWTHKGDSGASITIKATTGPRPSKEIKPETFEEKGLTSAAKLTNIAAEDLADKDDMSRTLPNSVMTPLTLTKESSANMTIPAGGAKTYDLTFDFGGERLRPGVYNGFVRVEGDNFETLRLPLQISLRHPFLPWPFVAFMVGTALAVGLQLYASKYRRRDQALSATEYWQKHQAQKAEPEFYEFYGPFIQRRLGSAKTLLRSPEWGKDENLLKAEELIKGVRTLRHRWLEHGQAFHYEKARLDKLGKALKKEYDTGEYRYILARKRALKNIREGLDLDSYDTGQKLESAVTAEVQRLEAFDRGYKASRIAKGAIENVTGLPEDSDFDPEMEGLPGPLKRAFEGRLADEIKVLRESEDDAPIKSTEANFFKIVQDLNETVSFYRGVAGAMVLLRDHLADICSDLEGDERKDYDARLLEQRGKLAAAGAKDSVTAVSEAVNKMTEDLQRLYTSDRLFYYRMTPGWIDSIDETKTGQYLGWEEVKARMDTYQKTADDLVGTTFDQYELASNYMFCRWRILWFYQKVMPWVYEKVEKPLADGPVKDTVKKAVVWLLGNTHHALTPEQFDREFLDNHVEKVYEAVNATLPEPLKGPAVPPRPERPSYRPFPSLDKVLPTWPAGPGSVQPKDIDWTWNSPFEEPGKQEPVRESSTVPGALVRAIGDWLGRLWGFITHPDFRLGLFGLGVWIMAFAVLLYFGWSEWNGNDHFGASWEDYFKIVFLSFAGLTTTNQVVNSALNIVQGWGAELPKKS